MEQQEENADGYFPFLTPQPSPTSEKRLSKRPFSSCSNSPIARLPRPFAQKHGRHGVGKCLGAGVHGMDCKENKSSNGGKADLNEHDFHIWTERERRKKMRDMFASLHSLLPQLPAKTDKSTIVDEAVNYIRSLQQTLHDLQKRKLDRMRTTPASTLWQQTSVAGESREAFVADMVAASGAAASNTFPTTINSAHGDRPVMASWSSPNVVLSVHGCDGHLSVCGLRRPGLLTLVMQVLEKHKLEVVTAQVSCHDNTFTCMIHARANGFSEQLGEAWRIEESFKLAAGEVLLWVSS